MSDEQKLGAEGRLDELVITVDAAMAEFYFVPRNPRSKPYELGVRAVISKHCEGTKVADFDKYKPGTPESDAFHSGVQEGWRHVLVLRERANSATGEASR